MKYQSFIQKGLLNDSATAYQAPSDESLIEAGRAGLPRTILDEMADFLRLPVSEFVAILPVTLRTVQRYKSDDVLPSNLSDHLVQLFDLYQFGKSVFQAQDAFVSWYSSPNTALGGVTPFSLCDTGYGIKMVRNILGRIQHGVFS